MSEKKPNDRYTDRKVNPYSYEDKKPGFFEKINRGLKRFFKDIWQLLKDAYKKYDAFIRRIFKLEELPEDKKNKKTRTPTRKNSHAAHPKHTAIQRDLDEYKSYTRKRESSVKKEKPLETMPDMPDGGETQRFDRLPDYLQEKQYSGPIPIVGLEPETENNDDDEHHHLSIFKRRQKPRSFVTSVLLTLVKIFVAVMLIMATSGIGLIQGIANAYVDTTPELDLTKIEEDDETSFIYDCNGDLITSFVGLENRISATIDEVPDMLKYAFVAVEDERFYTHNGIDIKRIFGAFFSNLRTDSTQGGSTITQQLIKLKILSSEQTYKRKLQEAYLAIELEKNYTKDEILISYMNTINLGSGNYGIKAAARDYFGKELSELTIRECAMLAGIANGSYLYNPRYNYYDRNTPETTDDRTDKVLLNMYRAGYISQSQYEEALEEDVYIIEESSTQQMYDMPYFLEYAIDDVVEHFIRDRGLDNNATNRNAIENELRTSGYHIYTTVDPVIQQAVEDSLYNWEKYPNTRYESDETVTVQNSDGTTEEVIQPQAAAVVYDYHTGQLKAIVGGRQEPQVKKALNRAVDSLMSVGSSIKPLSVYGPALSLGLSTNSILYDLPVAIDGWNTEEGYPDNYGGTFSGAISMREALYRSVNNVAARILLDYVGLEESYSTLEALGISTEGLSKDGSGLALGTSGISVLDMAVAYGAVANSGTYIEPIAFTQVVDSDGTVLLDATDSTERITRNVFSTAVSWLLVDMMTDVVEKGTGTNAQIDDMTVAGKTGTNSDYRGVFFAGMTPYYSAAVWIGSDSNKPLAQNATGGSSAAPLWQDFMSTIHEELELEDQAIISDDPESLGLVEVTVCPISGLLATEACENNSEGLELITDWVLASEVPTEECNICTEFRICLKTGLLATPYCTYGSETDPYYVAVFPSDHLVNQLTDEEFAEYFPNSMRGLGDDLSLITYDNEEFSYLYCTIHTEEWYSNLIKVNTVISSSITLIDTVNEILDTYSDYINEEVRLLSEDYIQDMEDAIVTEDYDTISTAYSELTSLKVAYLDPIVDQYYDVVEGAADDTGDTGDSEDTGATEDTGDTDTTEGAG